MVIIPKKGIDMFIDNKSLAQYNIELVDYHINEQLDRQDMDFNNYGTGGVQESNSALYKPADGTIEIVIKGRNKREVNEIWRRFRFDMTQGWQFKKMLFTDDPHVSRQGIFRGVQSDVFRQNQLTGAVRALTLSIGFRRNVEQSAEFALGEVKSISPELFIRPANHAFSRMYIYNRGGAVNTQLTISWDGLGENYWEWLTGEFIIYHFTGKSTSAKIPTSSADTRTSILSGKDADVRSSSRYIFNYDEFEFTRADIRTYGTHYDNEVSAVPHVRGDFLIANPGWNTYEIVYEPKAKPSGQIDPADEEYFLSQSRISLEVKFREEF